MWLRKGENVVQVPDGMPETVARCLGDGWVEVPDPRVTGADPVPGLPIPEPEPDAPTLPQRSPLPPLDVPLSLPERRRQRGQREGRR